MAWFVAFIDQDFIDGFTRVVESLDAVITTEQDGFKGMHRLNRIYAGSRLCVTKSLFDAIGKSATDANLDSARRLHQART